METCEVTHYDWTSGSVARLIELWAGDMSASQIGVEMGISKNQVIGKVHRLGLPKRQPCNATKYRKSRGAVSRPAARKNRELPCPDKRAAFPSRPSAASIPGVASSAVERLGSSPQVENLPGAVADEAPRRVFSDEKCQFIYGDDRRAYRFCDAPCVARGNGAASPYCAEHYALCLISPKKAEAARKAQRAADNAAGRMRWQAPSAWR